MSLENEPCCDESDGLRFPANLTQRKFVIYLEIRCVNWPHGAVVINHWQHWWDLSMPALHDCWMSPLYQEVGWIPATGRLLPSCSASMYSWEHLVVYWMMQDAGLDELLVWPCTVVLLTLGFMAFVPYHHFPDVSFLPPRCLCRLLIFNHKANRNCLQVQIWNSFVKGKEKRLATRSSQLSSDGGKKRTLIQTFTCSVYIRL